MKTRSQIYPGWPLLSLQELYLDSNSITDITPLEPGALETLRLDNLVSDVYAAE